MPAMAPTTTFDFRQIMPMTSDFTAVMAAMNLPMINLCTLRGMREQTVFLQMKGPPQKRRVPLLQP